ncbi:uncharacterized protein LAESUDRAFT_306311 [Laetiporus sulphureus 93-53]|uniref:Uncharacterized protein n=1 Tax=Laetiporus sulphureus 93-53 TaxID=1314785 RepID=A0A165D8U7_9APHY|nr:uncharacterized protein LAESUDRAFT_306311 [Laetiporus sulphureus 93-53]KZT04354.1 hypothetical protein LAESUDRAFT_306311 [Laetiporus sulphureus 93-53]
MTLEEIIAAIKRLIYAQTDITASTYGSRETENNHNESARSMSAYKQTISIDNAADESSVGQNGVQSEQRSRLAALRGTRGDDFGEGSLGHSEPRSYFAIEGELLQERLPSVDRMRRLRNGRPLPPPAPLPEDTPGNWEWQETEDGIGTGFRVAVSVPMSAIRWPSRELYHILPASAEAVPTSNHGGLVLRTPGPRGDNPIHREVHEHVEGRVMAYAVPSPVVVLVDPARMDFLHTSGM